MFFVSIAHTPFDAAIFSNASLLVIRLYSLIFSPLLVYTYTSCHYLYFKSVLLFYIVKYKSTTKAAKIYFHLVYLAKYCFAFSLALGIWFDFYVRFNE
jgi:hypothetical protein